jgi:hypothetical protein
MLKQQMRLPIGPDTSHILAEIIGVAIDLELQSQLGAWPPGFRYVDDCAPRRREGVFMH